LAARILAQETTEALAKALGSEARVVVIVPVGSVEPHGPHLPLGTDTYIGEAVTERAAVALDAQGIHAFVGPSIPYGVTDFAEGFAGAISMGAAPLSAFLRAVAEGYLRAGFAHVCFVSNHLEPAHDAAVRASIEGLARGRASVASPLTRRWGRTLGDEYKSGACHAGRYETSLVLAARPELVDATRAESLPALEISLSDGIRTGKTSFAAMGMGDAYTGAPSAASASEGEQLLARLAHMVVTEVSEALATIPIS